MPNSNRRGRPLGVRPVLTLRQIVAWAEAHHTRTGCWPEPRSGAVGDAAGESWSAIHEALRRGWRGLPGGMTTLAELLAAFRGEGWDVIDQLDAWGWALFRQRTPRHSERDEAMGRDRAAGMSLTRVGAKYGLTKQRVHQIIGRPKA